MADTDPKADAASETDAPPDAKAVWVRYIKPPLTVIADAFALLQKAITGFAITGVLAAIIVLIVHELRRPSIVVEPVSVPEALSDRGWTSEVVGQRLADEMRFIVASGTTSKGSADVITRAFQQDVVAPGTGLSLQSVISTVRAGFGFSETRIGGEVFCPDISCSGGLKLRWRVLHEQSIYSNELDLRGRLAGFDFQPAALEILRAVDPYVAALHYYQKADPSRPGAVAFRRSGRAASSHPDIATALRLARDMLGQNHPDAAWAANLIGNVAKRDDDYVAARFWYTRAIDLAAENGPHGFTAPINNLAIMALQDGDLDVARDLFQRSANVNRRDGAAYRGLASVVLAEEDGAPDTRAIRVALGYMDRQIRLTGDHANDRIMRSELLRELGEFSKAYMDLEQAVEIDPDDPAAWYGRAAWFADRNNPERDVARAIANFDRVKERQIDFDNLHNEMGLLYVELNEFGPAIRAFLDELEYGSLRQAAAENLVMTVDLHIDAMSATERCAWKEVTWPRVAQAVGVAPGDEVEKVMIDRLGPCS